MQTNCAGYYGGVWRSVRLVGVWSHRVDLVILIFAGIRLQFREDDFTYNSLYEDIL
jgi:hypothetical protein